MEKDIKRRYIRNDRLINSGTFRNTFTLPRYIQATIIRIEETRHYSRPEFLSSYFFRTPYPTLKKIISLKYDASCQIANGVYNPEDLDLQVIDRSTSQVFLKQILAEYLDKLPKDKKIPFPEETFSAFYVSLPPKGERSYSWGELGAYYYAMIQNSFQSSPEISTLAGALKPGNKSEILEQAFELIKSKIRYHADEENFYGFIPRLASDIFKNEYGDCKEIATLLKVLLATQNIESNVALVSTSGHIQALNQYPTLGRFNHMVLYLDNVNLEPLFLDGTIFYSHCENSYFTLLGQKAFIIDPTRSDLVVIGKRRSYKNKILTNSKIIRDESNGDWVLEGTVDLIGHAAFNFNNRLHFSHSLQKNSEVKRLLQKDLSVNPQKFELNHCDSEMVKITYKALFNRYYIPLADGGFKLTTPSLFSRSDIPLEDDVMGPFIVREFEQEDTWQIPFCGKSDSIHVKSNNISGYWMSDATKVMRHFSQHETRLSNHCREQAETVHERKMLAEFVTWK